MTTAVIAIFLALLFLIICRPVTVDADKPGIGGRVYRNTGTYGSPTWTAQDKVLSVVPAMPWDKVESGSRATRAKTKMKSRAELSFTVVMKASDSDAGYLAFRAAAVSPTAVLDLLILDGLISVEGVHGWRGEFILDLPSAAQEPDGSIYDTFQLEPAATTNAAGPSTVIMGSGSTPAYTAI